MQLQVLRWLGLRLAPYEERERRRLPERQRHVEEEWAGKAAQRSLERELLPTLPEAAAEKIRAGTESRHAAQAIILRTAAAPLPDGREDRGTEAASGPSSRQTRQRLREVVSPWQGLCTWTAATSHGCCISDSHCFPEVAIECEAVLPVSSLSAPPSACVFHC